MDYIAGSQTGLWKVKGMVALCNSGAMKGETSIQDLLSRRADLSLFLVHLTRDTNGKTARQNLRSILNACVLEARNSFGPAKEIKGRKRSQRCVSFSEVPLAFVHCLVGQIPGRRIALAPYGLAFTKMWARQSGANPVWYIDITPGHDFLTVPIDKMIKAAVREGGFSKSAIARVSPFIEQMGSGTRISDGQRYRKEFWWEREWRHVGDFRFMYQDVVLGFAPEKEIEAFEELVRKPRRRSILFVDPRWSADRMIAHLARCDGALSPFDSED